MWKLIKFVFTLQLEDIKVYMSHAQFSYNKRQDVVTLEEFHVVSHNPEKVYTAVGLVVKAAI